MRETPQDRPEANEKERRDELKERTRSVAAKCVIQHTMDQWRVLAAKPDRSPNPDYGTPQYVIQKMADIIRFTGGKVTTKNGEKETTHPRTLVLDTEKDDAKNPHSMLTIKRGADGSSYQASGAADAVKTNIIMGRNGDALQVALPDNATASISMNEMILAMTARHGNIVLDGMDASRSKIVIAALAFVNNPDDRHTEPPTETELLAAEKEVRHIGKFDVADAIAVAVRDEQRAQIAKPIIERNETATDNKKTPEELENEILAALQKSDEERQKNPDSLAALYSRLTTDPIQNISDLTEAMGIMVIPQRKRLEDDLMAEIARVHSNEMNAQTQAASTTDPTLKQNYTDEQTKHYSERRKLEAALEGNRKYLKDMHSINESIFTKMQRGEFDTSDIETFTAMLKGKEDVTNLSKIMLKNAGISQDELIESLPPDQREFMIKLLEIGGPILMMMLVALIENMRRSAEN